MILLAKWCDKAFRILHRNAPTTGYHDNTLAPTQRLLHSSHAPALLRSAVSDLSGGAGQVLHNVLAEENSLTKTESGGGLEEGHPQSPRSAFAEEAEPPKVAHVSFVDLPQTMPDADGKENAKGGVLFQKSWCNVTETLVDSMRARPG